MWSGGVVLITVVQDEGSVYSWSVTLDANGMVCLAGTPQGAGYTVCASFAQGLLDCYPDKVSVGGKGDPLQSCFTPASISSGTLPVTSVLWDLSVGFEPSDIS